MKMSETSTIVRTRICINRLLFSMSLLIVFVAFAVGCGVKADTAQSGAASVSEKNINATVPSDSLKKDHIKTEEELKADIEAASELRVIGSGYEDFDRDGNKELFALCVLTDDLGFPVRENGQIWYANTNGASLVMDTKTDSAKKYGLDSETGILHFGESVHFTVRSGGDKKETLSFACVEGKPQLIFQDIFPLIELESGVFIRESDEDYKLVYEEGRYFGCGLSKLDLNQVMALPGMEAELQKARKDVETAFRDYPICKEEFSYYGGDGNLYVLVRGFKNQKDYEAVWEYSQYISDYNGDYRAERYDTVTCTLVFQKAGNRFEYKGRTEYVPKEPQDLDLYYKPLEYANIKTEGFSSLSKEEYQAKMLEQLSDHYLCQASAVGISNYSCECEDFDNDGSYEMFAYINGEEDESWSFLCGLYYVDEAGIINISQGMDFEMTSGFYGMSKVSVGDSLFIQARLDLQIYGHQFLMSSCGEGIIKHSSFSGNAEIGMISSDENGNAYVSEFVNACYDWKTGEVYNGGYTQIAGGVFNDVRIDYLNGKFYEYASIELDRDDLMRLFGSKECVSALQNSAKEALNEDYSYYSHKAKDYEIKSAYVCSDGFVYVNMFPSRNTEKYGYDSEGDVETVMTAVIKLRIESDKLVFVDAYSGYRWGNMTALDSIYPPEKDWSSTILSIESMPEGGRASLYEPQNVNILGNKASNLCVASAGKRQTWDIFANMIDQRVQVGRVTSQGDDTFFYMKGSIYHLKPDGEVSFVGKKYSYWDGASCLNVIGTNLFFLEEKTIYRVGIDDGSSEEAIVDGVAAPFFVRGDSIYYVEEGESGYRLIEFSVSENREVRVFYDNSRSIPLIFRVDSNSGDVYYYTSENNGYRINIYFYRNNELVDTLEDIYWADSASFSVIPTDSRILINSYYNSGSASSKINKWWVSGLDYDYFSIDAEHSPNTVNAYGDSLITLEFDYSDFETFLSIDNGVSSRNLTKDSPYPSDLCVVGDYIYYAKETWAEYSRVGNLYRIRVDGTGWEPVYESGKFGSSFNLVDEEEDEDYYSGIWY